MRKTHKGKLSSTSAKMISQSAPVTIKAGEGEASGPPTFEAVAYDGSAPVPGYTANPKLDAPYVLNLAGMTQGRGPKANLEHKGSQRVGHLTGFDNDGKQVKVAGALSAATSYRDEVANSAAGGFPWEVSIEAEMSARRKIAAGKSAVVNGVKMSGPLYVFDKSVLTDIAFVSRGANEGNHVTIAASAAKDEPMNEFEKFAAKLGIDLDNISADDKAELQQMFNAKQGKGKTASSGTTLAELAAEEEKNNARISKINEISVAYMRKHPAHINNIQHLGEMAIQAGSSADEYELQLIRSGRTLNGSFSIHATANKPDQKVYEAAICMMSGLKNIEKHYSEQTLDAVDRAGLRNNVSVNQLLMQVASDHGYHCRAGERVTVGNIRTVLEYAFPPAHARMSTGFSTVSLPGILGNVANKMILDGYMEEDQTWREISTVKPASNFYTHTHYRMLDNLEYEEIGSGGEIPHGTLGQASYTSQVKTYGKMLGLTRNQIVNDDLGAFSDIRERLGRGAAQKFNNVFWARFMANLATMFPVDKSLGNYNDGTPGSVLGVDGVGLQAGITAYRKLRTPSADGQKRVGVTTSPSILLVPPELEFNAARLYQSTNVNTGGAATAESVGNANIHAGRYRPVVQNRLSDTAFTGNSTTAWYLFGSQLKAMLVTLLNGNATPIIESSDADFDTLGILFRGYHDFGCDPAEYLAGIMSKGAAS
jgi:hypothetical protein